ncbi:MAG: AAA family ATPase [Bacilli bacterium]|nr:AAA family ATPase [Bacilli bacterium]
MIISISGPASTGKTTLIRKIKEIGKLGKYSKIVIVNEVIRDIFKNNFLPKVGSMENMMKDKELVLEWIEKVGQETSMHINNEIKKNLEEDTLIILDRCIIDHFIYSIMHTAKFDIPLEGFYNAIKTYTLSETKIDYIFLTSIPEKDFYDIDGIRPKDWEETRGLENSLFQLLFGNNCINLPYDIDERISIIDSTISYRKEENKLSLSK